VVAAATGKTVVAFISQRPLTHGGREMFFPSRQRRLNLPQTPDRDEVQPSLTRRGNIRQPSRGLNPTAKFKAPRCGGGICEDAAEEYVKSTWKADFTYFPSAENKARFGDYYSKSKWIKSSHG